MDSTQHATATYAKAVVRRKVGSTFSAFDGVITGTILAIVPNRMIVQSWRSKHWKKTDLDSILVLTFSKAKRGAQIDLVHANVPEHDHDGVTKGWKKYYLEALEGLPGPKGWKSRGQVKSVLPVSSECRDNVVRGIE